MIKLARRVLRDRRGATAIEYGLIAAFIAIGIITALGAVKTNLAAKFDTVATNLQ